MRNKRRGATTVEMTLVGIPIIFTLICIFEISRGMWIYHTLAYSVKSGVRFAIVHGRNCIGGGTNPNNCSKTISDVATQIKNSAIGPVPAKTMLTFSPGNAGAASTQCYLAAPGANPPFGSYSACSTFNTAWPPDDGSGTLNGVGKRIRIDIATPFPTALSMFWPGSHPVKFGVVNFGASAADYIVF